MVTSINSVKAEALVQVTKALINVTGGYVYSANQLAQAVSKSAKFLFPHTRDKVVANLELEVLLTLANEYRDSLERKELVEFNRGA